MFACVSVFSLINLHLHGSQRESLPVTPWMELLAVLILAAWTNKGASTLYLQMLTLEKVHSQTPHFLSRGSPQPHPVGGGGVSPWRSSN